MERMTHDTTVADVVASREVAETIVRRECPDADGIMYVEHGHSNLVAQVDERYVFRFPRDADMLKRFEYETALLQLLGERQLAPLPSVYKKSLQPAFAVLQFLPGEHLTQVEVLALSPAKQATYGAQLASFVYAFQQSVTVAEVKKLRQATRVDEVEDRWERYLPKAFATPPANENLRTIIDHLYGEWQTMVVTEHRDIVVHGDLHGQNILFADGRLSGVLDFEFADVGSIEQECRTLYQFGEHLLDGFVHEYERLSKKTIRLDHVRTWAIVGELATFCTRTRRGQTSHPSYLRARENLRAWLPEHSL